MELGRKGICLGRTPAILFGVTVILMSLVLIIPTPTNPLGCQQVLGNTVSSEHAALNENTEDKAREWIEHGMKATKPMEKARCYLEALKLEPSHPLAHNNLGDVYETQGRFQEALREYNRAVTFLPTFASAHFGIGDVNLKLGRFHYAVRAYEIGLLLTPDDELSTRRMRIARLLMQAIRFDFDSSGLTSEAEEQVRCMAEALQQEEIQELGFEVEGHADSMGTLGYNLKLSVSRAQTVKDYLVNVGHVSVSRLRVQGYGESTPVTSNETEEGRARNRRVVLRALATNDGSGLGR